MSILSTVAGWWAIRRRHEREAYADARGFATPEELDEVERHRPFSSRVTGGMPEGTGISPTGTPMDFTADEAPPRY
jgi:hypothetical protein